MIRKAKTRTDIPLRNSVINRFMLRLNPAFDFFPYGPEQTDYDGPFFKYPEIYTTREMELALMDRGFGVEKIEVRFQEEIEHDYWTSRMALVAELVVASGTWGMTVSELSLVSAFRNLQKHDKVRMEKDLRHKYGIWPLFHIKTVNNTRHAFVQKKFMNPDIHHHKERDFITEMLIQKIIGTGAAGMSRRDLMVYSRRYRALDEIEKADVHFEMKLDPRITFKKVMRGQGSGHFAYAPIPKSTDEFI